MSEVPGRGKHERVPGTTTTSTIEVDGRTWERVIVGTHWIEAAYGPGLPAGRRCGSQYLR